MVSMVSGVWYLLKASLSMTMWLLVDLSILRILTSLNVVFLTISLLLDSLNFLIATKEV